MPTRSSTSAATRTSKRRRPAEPITRRMNAKKARQKQLRVALIGGGSIACVIARPLIDEHPEIRLVGALGHDVDRANRRLDACIPITSSIEEFLEWKPQLVVECAGHEALAEH